MKAIVKMDDVSLVKEVTAYVVYLIPDKIDRGLLLSIRRGRLGAASPLSRPLFLGSMPHGLRVVF